MAEPMVVLNEKIDAAKSFLELAHRELGWINFQLTDRTGAVEQVFIFLIFLIFIFIYYLYIYSFFLKSFIQKYRKSDLRGPSAKPPRNFKWALKWRGKKKKTITNHFLFYLFLFIYLFFFFSGEILPPQQQG